MDVEQAPPQPRCLDCGHHQLNHNVWLGMLTTPCNWRGCGCPSFIGQQQPPQVEFTITCPDCHHLASCHITGYGCRDCANIYAKDATFKVCERKQ